MTAACVCGHAVIDHHGVDPAEGCLGVISHKLPPCPCSLTAGAVHNHPPYRRRRDHPSPDSTRTWPLHPLPQGR